jgi:hypothetical protein
MMHLVQSTTTHITRALKAQRSFQLRRQRGLWLTNMATSTTQPRRSQHQHHRHRRTERQWLQQTGDRRLWRLATNERQVVLRHHMLSLLMKESTQAWHLHQSDELWKSRLCNTWMLMAILCLRRSTTDQKCGTWRRPLPLYISSRRNLDMTWRLRHLVLHVSRPRLFMLSRHRQGIHRQGVTVYDQKHLLRRNMPVTPAWHHGNTLARPVLRHSSTSGPTHHPPHQHER